MQEATSPKVQPNRAESKEERLKRLNINFPVENAEYMIEEYPDIDL